MIIFWHRQQFAQHLPKPVCICQRKYEKKKKWLKTKLKLKPQIVANKRKLKGYICQYFCL